MRGVLHCQEHSFQDRGKFIRILRLPHLLGIALADPIHIHALAAEIVKIGIVCLQRLPQKLIIGGIGPLFLFGSA